VHDALPAQPIMPQGSITFKAARNRQ
jgi:hypothetical protein